jgi:DNA-binding IscR family transcriptional regulator
VLCSHPDHESGHRCATKLLWTRVQGGVIRALQTTTLADLVAFAERAPAPAAGAATLHVTHSEAPVL